MRKLRYPPDSSGYTFTDAEDSVMIELDGGMPRIRRDVMNGAITLNCAWTLDQEKYDYMRRFYRVAIEQDAGKFLCDLVIDDAELTEHECLYMPGTFKLNSQSGHTYNVGCSIKVVPIYMDTDAEGSRIDLEDIYGSNAAARDILNNLHLLANVHLGEI